MTTEQAFQVLVNVAEAGNKAGLFNLTESATTLTALNVIKEKITDAPSSEKKEVPVKVDATS